MSSYTVYITKSRSAALAMARGFACEIASGEPDSILSAECGYADGKDIVPGKYHGKSYYYCTVERKSETEKYEIIVC